MKQQLSFRERHSVVWLENGRIYKSQPKYNTDNEFFFLKALEKSGYVPQDVRKEGIELISMEYIKPERVTNRENFLSHYWDVLKALKKAGIRHGDLTEYSVLVKNNRPVLIDFAESRWESDIIPDKRNDLADMFWLKETMDKLCDM